LGYQQLIGFGIGFQFGREKYFGSLGKDYIGV
jgi:hypothetical protein